MSKPAGDQALDQALDPAPAQALDAAQCAQDWHWMGCALEAAAAAAAAGEVPVGAVLVQEGREIARAHNAPISQCDPCAHAEVLALRAGAQHLGNYRLDGCTLYVTLEPCAMCSAALMQARVARVVFGAPEPKTGAAGSVLDLFAHTRLNHHTLVQSGLRAPECAALLQDFFRQRRQAQRAAGQAAHPLRPDALRTPESCFTPCAPAGHYVSDLPALAGLRLHARTLGPESAPHTWLLLHGAHSWSEALLPLAQALANAGQRVLLPDAIGFGRSDKPKKASFHSIETHAQILAQWLAGQSSSSSPNGHSGALVLVTQDLLATHIAALALAQPLAQPLTQLGRTPDLLAWLQLDAPVHPQPDFLRAPYPDAGHSAGPRAWAAGMAAGLAHAPPPWPHLPPLRAPWPPTAEAAQALAGWALGCLGG